MSDDQFTQLKALIIAQGEQNDKEHLKIARRLGAIQDHLETLSARSATRDHVSAVYDLLDKNIAEHERQEQERTAMSHQLDRHTKQLDQLASHVGVELRYE